MSEPLSIAKERKEYETVLAALIEEHDKNSDLQDHIIGKDQYCLICEQYTNKMNEFTEKYPPVKEKKKLSFYEIYEVALKNGEMFLVCVNNLESIYSLLKREKSSIVRTTKIQKKYFNSIYVETQQGSVMALKQLYKKKNVVLASKENSQAKNRGLCYNEKPFEYHFYSKKDLPALKNFCTPYPISRTKKFNSLGRVTIGLPTGMIAISDGMILLKVTPTIFVQISEKEFQDLFTIEENLVWLEK